jgi:hypothetical protein
MTFMKKQNGKWAEQVKKYRIRMTKAKTAESNYPAPRDGIVMHIDELKEKLMAIQAKFGVDPSLLPEVIRS